MLDFYVPVITAVLSAAIGVDLKDIRKSLNKEKSKKSSNLEISDNIDTVSKKLEESKEIIDNALLEMDKQKKLFEQMKKDAEISQQISSMNSEQISALNEVLEKTLNKQDRKSLPKNLFINLFFCILSAVIGFALGKLFSN